jgi:DNA modification methylase
MDINMAASHPTVSRKVELRPLAALKPAKRNARTHSDRQVEQIAASINAFGFTSPLLVDGEGVIVAGHGRLEAARRLGMADVPVILLEDLTPDELRAYAIADNRIAENAGWDNDILRIEFEALQVLDLPFEIELTGFNTTQIDVIIDGKGATADSEPLPVVDARDAPGVEHCDLWILGDHRLLCGSALNRDDFAVLMGDDRARMIFSDPPYNVRIDGHVCGLGIVKHAEFRMASGEMTQRQFTDFLTDAFRNAAEFSVNGAIHYQCMDWRHMVEMMEAGEAVYSELKNLCVWSKDNGGMGAFYRSQHELVFVWKVGTDPHLNTIELGRNGRYRTNIWEYPAASKTGKGSDLAMHPTVKPVPMIMDAIKDTSKRKDIVLDCFGGSGSTLIAAEKTKRRARLIELEPGYCEVTILRWEELTGSKATLAETGETFEAVKARRVREMEQVCDAALGEAA